MLSTPRLRARAALLLLWAESVAGGRGVAVVTGGTGGIGLATIRRDGFISLRAGARSASVTTKVLRFNGNRLTVNALTQGGGHVVVELQDAVGNPIPGFAMADCEGLAGEEVDRVVRWKRGSAVSGLAGRPIRMRFVLRDADLFSIKFDD